MKILVTGGAGYIGSHTAVELLNSGYDISIVDNLSNSKPEVIDSIKKITGKDFHFYEADLTCREAVNSIFENEAFDAVIHFAGLKAVGESVRYPMRYYENNILSSLVLFQTMAKYNVKKLVFSSSATVYGSPESVPINEDFPLRTTNPYGSTKLMIEDILRDVYTSDQNWSIAILRYFNPIGAHKSGLIGEDPNGIPNNLLPFIAKVAVGELPCLHIFGNDYDTKDGTGVRDYIHVCDLANAHVKAIQHIAPLTGVFTYNLGTGNGYSVLEILKAFEKASGVTLNHKFAPRRPGDIAECYADPSKANNELGWHAENGIYDMCLDTWNFAKKNF